MAYGVKRGIKTPGEYGMTDIFGLALAGSAGIIAALVTDFQQKGEASAIYTLNQWAAGLGNLAGVQNIPLYWVILGLMAVGAGSIFYFQPITRQGAFAQGFGLLAVMMTAVPADLAGGLVELANSEPLPAPAIEESMPSSTEAAAVIGQARIINAAHQPALPVQPVQLAEGQARVHKVQVRQSDRYNVSIEINFPKGLPYDVNTMIRRGTLRGRLHNAQTNKTYNLFRTAGGGIQTRGNSIIVRTGVPATSNSATLWIRVEAEKYRIEQQSAQVKIGQSLNWKVNMAPSNTPLFMQRLRQSYWF